MESKHRLLLVQSGLASRVLKDVDITRSLLSEIQSMGEKYIFEMIAEQGLERGLEKGREEGAREEARDAILEVLRRRFRRVSRPVAQQLLSIEKLPRLKKLVGEAAVTPSLDAFLALLAGRRR